MTPRKPTSVLVAFVRSLVVVVAGVVVYHVVTGAPSSAGGPKPPSGLGRLFAAVLITQALFLGTVVQVVRPLSWAGLKLGPSRARPITYAAIAMGLLALSGTCMGLAGLAGFDQRGTLEKIQRATSGARGLSLALALFVLGPLVAFGEELFFRGVVQPRLTRRWGAGKAIVVTSAFFGLAHLDPVQGPVAFVLGLWLGLVAERAGSIGPSMLAHAFNNSVATLGAAFAHESPDRATYAAVGAFYLVIFLLCARHVLRALPPVAPPPLQAEADRLATGAADAG